MTVRPIASTPLFDDTLLLFGRFAFAAVFLPSGIRKLSNFPGFAEGLAGRGLPFGLPLPFPEAMAVLAVAIETIAPLMVLLGVGARWGALALVAFTAMATLTSHRFWEFEEEAARARQTAAFWRNLAYMGGLSFLYVAGPGRLSLDRWLAARRE